MPGEQRQLTTGDTGERIAARRKPLPRHWRDSRTEILNLFPEVRWDRCAGDREQMAAYGWIARTDGRFDFLVLEFQEQDDGRDVVWFTTSSAELSREFQRRLLGTDEGHFDCQRIESVFPDVVNCIRLRGSDSDVSMGDFES